MGFSFPVPSWKQGEQRRGQQKSKSNQGNEESNPTKSINQNKANGRLMEAS